MAQDPATWHVTCMVTEGIGNTSPPSSRRRQHQPERQRSSALAWPGRGVAGGMSLKRSLVPHCTDCRSPAERQIEPSLREFKTTTRSSLIIVFMLKKFALSNQFAAALD